MNANFPEKKITVDIREETNLVIIVRQQLLNI